MIEPLSHILDWFVERRILSVPIASVILLALALLTFWFERRRHSGGAVAHAETGGKVQQTNVSRIRTKGDVKISPKQK